MVALDVPFSHICTEEWTQQDQSGEGMEEKELDKKEDRLLMSGVPQNYISKFAKTSYISFKKDFSSDFLFSPLTNQ